MASGDRRDAAARRSRKLWKVLVAGGMALAAACAGMQKGNSSGSGSDTGSSNSGSSSNGGGAAGW